MHAWKACVRQNRTVGSNPTLSANANRLIFHATENEPSFQSDPCLVPRDSAVDSASLSPLRIFSSPNSPITSIWWRPFFVGKLAGFLGISPLGNFGVEHGGHRAQRPTHRSHWLAEGEERVQPEQYRNFVRQADWSASRTSSIASCSALGERSPSSTAGGTRKVQPFAKYILSEKPDISCPLNPTVSIQPRVRGRARRAVFII